MSVSHKKALAEGRSNSTTVDRYLYALNIPKKRPEGHHGDAQRRLADARTRMQTAVGVEKVLAAQEIRDIQAKLTQAKSTAKVDIKGLEAAFIRIAKTFGERRAIGYGAWRDAGVPPEVLRRAGVARTARLSAVARQ